MIVRAIERGVTEAVIADALKDTNCSMKVFDLLRRMTAFRQIEAADLMIGQNNFSLHRPEYLTEFQRIAEIDSLGGLPAPSAE